MKKIIPILLALILISSSFSITVHIVGITQKENGKYEGIIANLTVLMKKGSGNIFVSTSPLTKVDTQASARLARDVACQVLDFNCSNYDFYYIIKSNSPIVGGP